jgi:DNA helicase II / ATP-dependent DNA helicase PcrA
VIADPPPTSGGQTPSEALHEILADLTPAQHRAVISPSSPLVVLAAAGAGKTRVLTRRIAHQVQTGRAGPDHVLALTFTRKAAGELGARLQSLGMRDGITAGTFHAVASAQLRRWWADRSQYPLTLLASPSRLLRPIAADVPALRDAAIGDLAAELAWAQARLIRPEHFATAASASGRRLPADSGELAALYARYEEEKRRRGLVDFDDLLARCADAMDDDPRFAAAQRWRWRHVFVDEFQDVNPLQHRLLLAWLGDDAELTVVGDANQAIYGWNGADPGLLDGVAGRWPGTEVVRLDDNHRCSPQIVAAGASVLGPSGVNLRSSRPDGPVPSVRSYLSDEAEAGGVAAELHDAHAGGLPWSQMAVLVRTNAQGQPLRRALEAAGIPCAAPSQADVLRHPAAVEALEGLRAQASLPIAVAVADLEAAAADAAGADGGAQGGGGGRLVGGRERVAHRGATDDGHASSAFGGAAANSAVLTLLADFARDLRRLDHRATVGGLLAWLPSAAGREPGMIGQPDAVTIASFHRAKGLEWRAVWVCGLEAGLVPITHASSASAQAEERRLLYVALTRAEIDLRCSWAARRTFGDRTSAREPSPWLTAIGEASTNAEPDSKDWRAVLAEQRRRLRQDVDDRHVGGARRTEAAERPRTAPGNRDTSNPARSEDRNERVDGGQGQLGLDLDAGAGPTPSTPPDAVYLPVGSEKVDVHPRSSVAPSAGTDTLVRDPQIASRVTSWRAARARGVGIPAQAVLQDRSIEALAVLRPSAAADLAQIPGLGAIRAARFGATLLELVAGTTAVA